MLFALSFVNDVLEFFEGGLLLACQLVFEDLVYEWVVEHLLHFVYAARVVHLVGQHLLVLLPGHQELVHLLYVRLVEVLSELLFDVEVA